MSAVTSFERIEPDVPCISPDGHNLEDLMRFGSTVPVRVMCTRCGKSGTVIVFA